MAFPRVVSESDVELGLDLWLVQPMPLREAEERLVARVVAEAVGEGVARRQVGAETPKPFVELRVIGVTERVDAHLLRIGAPVQKQVEEVPSPQPKGGVERMLRFGRPLVAVCDQEKHEGVVLSV